MYLEVGENLTGEKLTGEKLTGEKLTRIWPWKGICSPVAGILSAAAGLIAGSIRTIAGVRMRSLILGSEMSAAVAGFV